MEVLLNPEIFVHDFKKEALDLIDSIIEKFPNCLFLWDNEFYAYLFEDSNSVFNDRNFSAILPRIFNKFITETDLVDMCDSDPNLPITNTNISNKVLSIIHVYIHRNYMFLTLIGSDKNAYTCSCNCSSNSLLCKEIFSLTEFFELNKNTIINELWPEKKDDFYARFGIFYNIYGNSYKYNLKNIFFSNEFIKNFIDLPNILRENCLEKIFLRLKLTQQEAGQNKSLKDELIAGRKKNCPRWRFRVSKNSCWIHYAKQKDNSIKLEEINIVHDEGL